MIEGNDIKRKRKWEKENDIVLFNVLFQIKFIHTFYLLDVFPVWKGDCLMNLSRYLPLFPYSCKTHRNISIYIYEFWWLSWCSYVYVWGFDSLAFGICEQATKLLMLSWWFINISWMRLTSTLFKVRSVLIYIYCPVWRETWIFWVGQILMSPD